MTNNNYFFVQAMTACSIATARPQLEGTKNRIDATDNKGVPNSTDACRGPQAWRGFVDYHAKAYGVWTEKPKDTAAKLSTCFYPLTRPCFTPNFIMLRLRNPGNGPSATALYR